LGQQYRQKSVGSNLPLERDASPRLSRRMKKIVSTTEAPAAVGPYSQAVRVGQLVFTAGQIPLDPKSGQIVSEDIGQQTRRVLDNLTAVLAAENLTFNHIVKTTIFLTDLGDFQTVNEIYGGYFSQQPPARSTVQVSALPKGARVEIECIAVSDQTPAGGQLSVDVGE
jgi:2-iminobutanoate/2-iminopropanoate deaminase